MLKTFLAATSLVMAATPALAQTTYSQTSAPITVVDGGETTSTLTFSGTQGTITNLTVSLNLLSHTYPDDLVFGLLNESAGLGFVFMSGAGGSTDINNVTLTFSDFATDFLPESFVGGQIVSGTYLPSNYGAYEFTFFDNATSFADFNGLTADGNWTLYVDDVFPADGGQLLGGFTLNITTDANATPTVPEPATWGLMIAGFGAVGFAMRRRTKTSVRYA